MAKRKYKEVDPISVEFVRPKLEYPNSKYLVTFFTDESLEVSEVLGEIYMSELTQSKKTDSWCKIKYVEKING